jgi:ParB family chromosome partitioning protein
MSVTERRPGGGLGRGLASLIPQRAAGGGHTEIPVARIRRNPFQPRQSIDDAALQALTASVAEHGVLQPILVTATLDGYQLVAGERRLRAAELAGLERIPAVVREVTEQAQLELALIENLQRADLNPLEEAHAYRQLIDDFGLDQEAVAQRVGRARSSVANKLRLLDLASEVQTAVATGEITEGHARAIAGLADAAAQRGLLALVTARSLSVRQTEELARRMKEAPAPAAASGRGPDPDLERLEGELRGALGTRVSVTATRKGGRITIEYYSSEDFDRLYARLLRSDS